MADDVMLERRLKKKASVGILTNIRRAMKHLLSYLEENELGLNETTPDVLIDGP